jgi:hypothetical protein
MVYFLWTSCRFFVYCKHFVIKKTVYIQEGTQKKDPVGQLKSLCHFTGELWLLWPAVPSASGVQPPSGVFISLPLPCANAAAGSREQFPGREGPLVVSMKGVGPFEDGEGGQFPGQPWSHAVCSLSVHWDANGAALPPGACLENYALRAADCWHLL